MFPVSQSLESAQMHNHYLLQDCSNKHKRIILVVPLFIWACECNVQSSHSVPKDPGLQIFFTWKKHFNFPQSKQNLVQAFVSVFVEFGSVTKIIYDVKVIHHSPCGAPICLFVFRWEKLLNLQLVIYMIHELYMELLSLSFPVGSVRTHLRSMHIECDRFRRTLTINQFEFESLNEQCAYWNPS